MLDECVPHTDTRSKRVALRGEKFEGLCEIMARLRSPEGCPWDREQTHSSLVKYLIEESYEVHDAVEEGDQAELIKELGDVLLQVVFHSAIAEETRQFSIEDVIDSISQKMVRRHPHVFAEEQVADSDEVLQKWEQIKQQERGAETSILEGIPQHLPALQKAQRLQSRAAQVGFDWDCAEDMVEKIREEFEELNEARGEDDPDQIEAEFGDILFALVNWARYRGIEPERALQRTNKKFLQRFQFIEKSLVSRGSNIHQAELPEMDDLWEDAKKVQ